MTAQRHRIVIEGDDATNYSAYSPDVPGVVATGATREECERQMREAIEFHLEGLAQDAADAVGPLLAFENVSAHFDDGRRRLVVFDRVSFEVQPGEHVGILGRRRSGKSTLLRLAAGLDSPGEGVIRFEGDDTTAMSARKRLQLMRGRTAYLREPALSHQGESAVEFVSLPLLARGVSTKKAKHRARHLLSDLGVADSHDLRVNSLSLADRMWVKLAQALALEPSLLLVDEPAVIPSFEEIRKFIDALRRFASEREMSVMIASEEPMTLGGLDLLLSIEAGEVRQIERKEADVIAFPARSAKLAEGRRPKGSHSNS